MYSPNPNNLRGVLSNDGSAALAQAFSTMAARRMASAQEQARMRMAGSERFGSALNQGISRGSEAVKEGMFQRARKQMEDARLAEQIRSTNLASTDRANELQARTAEGAANRTSDWGRFVADLAARAGMAGMERNWRMEESEADRMSREKMNAADNATQLEAAGIRKGQDPNANPADAIGAGIVASFQEAMKPQMTAGEKRQLGAALINQAAGVLPMLSAEGQSTLKALAASLGVEFPQGGGMGRQDLQPEPWYNKYLSGRSQAPPMDPNSLGAMLGVGRQIPASQPFAPLPGSRPTYEQVPTLSPELQRMIDEGMRR